MFCHWIRSFKAFPLHRSFSEIRVRFAPSPTGYMHLGGLRMALINYAYARKNDGKFILRIEDTDQNRLVKGSIDSIFNSLDMLGLHPDESIRENSSFGPYIQSERLSTYQKYAEQLIRNGSAYYCFCSSASNHQKDSNHNHHCSCSTLSLSQAEERILKGEKYTIRLFMPDDMFVLHDKLRGEIAIKGSSVEDAVLMKSDHYPTYHLASVVDDHLMRISTVIRGEEWISSIPKHLQLYKAFGWEPPEFIHLPLLLSEKKAKISKRMGGFELKELLNDGYLPSALLNYIYYLGLKRGNDEEKGEQLFYSLDSIVKDFSISKLSSSPICVNPKLLSHINQQHIQYQLQSNPDLLITESIQYIHNCTDLTLPPEMDWKRFYEYTNTRIHTLQDTAAFIQQLYKTPSLDYTSIPGCQYIKDNQLTPFFKSMNEELSNLISFNHDAINGVMMSNLNTFADHRKKLMATLRICVTGSKNGFGLSEMMELIGKERVTDRINSFIRWLS